MMEENNNSKTNKKENWAPTDSEEQTGLEAKNDGIPSTIGEFFNREREQRGFSVKVIAQDTKISSTNINALEQNQFHLLPDRAYVLGYVKSYAKILNLDQALCVELFNQTYQAVMDTPQTPNVVVEEPKAQETIGQTSNDFYLKAGAGIVGLFIIFAVISFIGNNSTEQTPEETIQIAEQPTNEVQPQIINNQSPLNSGETIITRTTKEGLQETTTNGQQAALAAKKAEEERLALQAKKAEEERKALQAKKAEEERKALQAKKAEEERKALQAKKAEEERKALQAKKAEEERKALQAKKAEEERKALQAKKAEEERKALQAKNAEEERKALQAKKAQTTTKTTAKTEATKKESSLNLAPIKLPLYSIDETIVGDELKELIPDRFEYALREGVQNILINAFNGDTWLTYKADDNPIKKFVLREGRSVLIRGSEARIFLGNLGAARIFLNNQLLKVTSKSGVKSLVIPQENASKYSLPLFVFKKDGSVGTTDSITE